MKVKVIKKDGKRLIPVKNSNCTGCYFLRSSEYCCEDVPCSPGAYGNPFPGHDIIWREDGTDPK